MIETFSKLKTTNYLDFFGDNYVHLETDDYIIAVYPNQYDDFKFFSYVNGLDIKKGGTHIEFVMNKIVPSIREKLKKKHKNIKNGDIKNKLFLVLIMKNFSDLSFDSQSKELITNSVKDFNEYFKVDWDKFIKKILSKKEIIDPIVEIFVLKEEYKLQKELKSIEKKPKKIKNDKFLSAINERKYLILCEGDSAANSIARACGRENISYFAMFGVPVNALDSSLQKLASSKKVKELCEITGVTLSADNQNNLSHDNIVFATDADLPGFNIQCLLMGFFYRFGKNLFEEKRIHNFKTPLMVVKKGDKIIDWFYSFDEYHHKKNKYLKGYKIEYKKGLGSFDQEEFEFIIERDGFDNMLETIDISESDSIEKWLKSEYVQFRKQEILKSKFNILNL